MTRKITVLGAGHGGHATSAELSLYGFDVNLWEFPEYKSNIEPIVQRGGIEIKGAGKVGFGKLHRVTTDISEALEKDVDIVISTVVANAHGRIAELCVPHLRDGQVFLFWGKGGGSLIFRRVMKDKKAKAQILLGECPSLPYGARRRGPALVEVLSPLKKGVPVVGFPKKDTEKVLSAVRDLYPDRPDMFVAGQSVLESIMLDYNGVTHPAVTLCNAGRIEGSKADWPHWGEGFTPSVARLEAAIDEERLALVKALGLTGAPTEPIRSKSWLGPGGLLTTVEAPRSLDVRYVTEDTPCALVTYASLGDMLKVPTPVIDSMITIFSSLLDRDFRSGEFGARTAEDLGLAGMTAKQIRDYAG